MITDIHTHTLKNRWDAVVNGSPRDVEKWVGLWPEACFSTGIHPWATADIPPATLPNRLAELEAVAAHPRVVAIGETGLDGLRGGDTALQEQIFRAHISLSERVGKPLLLHVVKRADRLLAIRKELKHMLTQPWIWHGFRGKMQLADLFMDSATMQSPVYVSLGERFNEDVAMALPLSWMLAETDESPLSVTEVINRIAQVRGMDREVLQKCVAYNCHRILSGSGIG